MFTNFENMASKSKVYFFSEGVRVNLGKHSILSKAIEKIFRNEGRNLESINYIFCSDEQLRAINRDYLKHDYYTDIVTFDLSPEKNCIIGEVYISADRVRENAKTHSASIHNEFKRVIFHGALHLCGYKDKTRAEQRRMREREDFYLSKT